MQPVLLRKRRWQMAFGATVLGALTAASALVFPAHAQPPAPGPGAMEFRGPPEHVLRRLDSLLDGLGVTDAQRARVRQIGMAAAADLHAQHDAGRGLQERAARLFAAPNVDASAAEALRQEMLTQQDQSSKRVMQAMLDVAQVLTPEQRAKIGARMKDRQAVMQDRMQRGEHAGHMEHRPPGDHPRIPAPPQPPQAR